MRQFMVKHSKPAVSVTGCYRALALVASCRRERRARYARASGYCRIPIEQWAQQDGYDASSHGVRGRVTLRLPFDDTDQGGKNYANLYQVYRVASRQ